ncbi:5'-nucleotidase [Parahalioglobus pacificus]|uniref:5'-nucleotidase n=1 Tax=Parahalioglobus pacificus TaxID=930806 RepID=A0A919CJ19_9GAMM|nr:5'-nucleotidase [Halioglobus pacificus]NQY02406.1 5'-nucleotidase [Halieaceae bacterium]GHD29355.1 5'-nucleotidase [Halioglobus pacificus]
MAVSLADKLVIAISSRALFDLNDSHQVYMSDGLQAYSDYQIAREDEPLPPGEAFPLVHKLLRLNERLEEASQVEVVLLSRNSADTGLRVFNSIQHYDLNISRAAFCGGESPWRYINAFGCQLFLSNEADDVRYALDCGVAAATLVSNKGGSSSNNQLRFAFDGDAVVFSDEAEQVYKAQGLEAFTASEQASAHQPLSGGPFKSFLSALYQLQQAFPASEAPIRTALVTARSAPAHERVIRTLRAWNIRIDESIFLGGLDKTEFLRAYDADVFFDDQASHCASASPHIATGHVPHGVANR